MKVLELYQPYVSRTMSPGFQRVEVLLPIILAGLLAVFGSIPLFYRSEWGLGAVSLIVWAFLLYTIRGILMYQSATREPDGSLYVSPSVGSAVQPLIIFLSFVMTVGYFTLLSWWTGFLPQAQ